MGWILDMFSVEMLVLAVLGVLCVAGLVLVRRIWRSGLGTYDESHLKMERRIRDTDAEIRECNLSMPAGEQLHILEAALRELLELEHAPSGWAVRLEEKSLLLETPQGDVHLAYDVRRSVLRGDGRVMHGAAHWEADFDGGTRTFADLAQLAGWVRAVLQGSAALHEEGEDIPAVHFRQGRVRARRPRVGAARK